MRIELLDVSYSAASHNVLSNMCFCLEGSTQAVIVGKSGSGKSTFVKLITGLIKPSRGQITIDVLRTEIGIVEQVPSFYEHLSAFDNVLLAGAARGLSNEESTSRALEIFADLGISHIRTITASSLSAWERTRVAIARAWISDTSVVVLDQSFDGHDEVSVRTVIDALLRINANQRSIVITTSQPNFALLMPTALVYELRDGSLVNISKLPAEVLTDDQGDLA